MVEKIIKEALRFCEEAEIFKEENETLEVIFQSNKLKSIESSSSRGVGLRVIKERKIGFSSTTSFENMSLLIKRAVETSQFGEKATFSFPARGDYPRVKCFDKKILSLTSEEMIEIGNRILRWLLKEVPGVECEMEVGKALSRVELANSQGLRLESSRTGYFLSLYAFRAKEGDFLGVGEEKDFCRWEDFGAKLVEKIIKTLSLSRRINTISKGKYPVIFTPKAVGVIISPLKRGINGKTIQKGASPLMGKRGRPIFSSSFTLLDDGVLPWGPSSFPWDGEGIPTSSRAIVEKGILKEFIFDLQTASILGEKPTGNASRTYSSLPFPSPRNLLILPGEVDFESMVKDIKEGIVVDQLIGSGQGNPLSGEFSVSVDLGWKIERGKMKGRIKNALLSGNIYKLLNKIQALGKKPEWVGSLCVPHLYLKEVDVSA